MMEASEQAPEPIPQAAGIREEKITEASKQAPETTSQTASGNDEETNDIMTVSRIQIALQISVGVGVACPKDSASQSENHALQSALTEITLNTATDTPTGLFQLLQRVIELLLKHSEDWSHFQASSETVATPITAEELFNQLSLSDRSKFSVETLTNIDGVVTQKEAPPPVASATVPDNQPGYLVITLLLGTVDDQPLFGEVLTVALLKAVLQGLAAMKPTYLRVVEVLWTPQAPDEVLTEADLAADFGDLVAIA